MFPMGLPSIARLTPTFHPKFADLATTKRPAGRAHRAAAVSIETAQRKTRIRKRAVTSVNFEFMLFRIRFWRIPRAEILTYSLDSPLCLMRSQSRSQRHRKTGINGLKKRRFGPILFVTLGFGSLSQIAMRCSLRVFTRELFGFAEIIVVVALVYFLAAIALLNSFALGRANEWTALQPLRGHHIGKTTGSASTN
jgi:hypothetical protein